MHIAQFCLRYVFFFKMWLPVAYLIGLLISIQELHFLNALEIEAHSKPCISKIISCDWYRQSFFLDKENDMEMFTNIEDLEKICKNQGAYIRCMVRAERFCKKTIIFPMAKEMIDNRRFATEICHPFSPWKQLYLKEASCLNAHFRKAFVSCFDEIIGATNTNPDQMFAQSCKYGRDIIECSSAALQEKCGYYAGNILKKFLTFHILSDYKCIGFKAEYVNDDSPCSTSDDIGTDAFFNILEAADFDNEATSDANNMENTDSEKTLQDNLEIPVFSDNSQTKKLTTLFEFDDESLSTEEDSFSTSLDVNADMKSITVEPAEFQFPALPDYQYKHKNTTTFNLYENLETGYMKHMGCGVADVYWVIVSPLINKYCILTDLKSEHSGGLFKCSVVIDAPCSSELDDEDRTKNAEVFHKRYMVTILNPPKNRISEDMAIMNIHYLKVYPSPSLYAPEKKVNLWTAQANKALNKHAKSVSRKGPLELEDENNLNQHGNGSGQYTNTIMNPNYSDEDEYYEYTSWDYYPLEEEEDDIYFPEILRNDIIYIEDDKGDLISLHDPRSPIYSKSLYQPHSLFRPRIGMMPEESTNLHQFNENKSKQKKKSGDHDYCSKEAPCPPNSEFFKLGIKPGTHIDVRNIETFDPFKDMKLKPPPKIQSSVILNEINDVKRHSQSRYVVRQSTKIELPKPTETSYTEFYENQLGIYSSHPPEEEIYDDIDITVDPGHLYPDDSLTLASDSDSEDSESDNRESLGEYYSYAFTQNPFKYLRKSTDTGTIHEININSKDLKEPSSEKESMWEGYLLKVFESVWKILFKKGEQSFKRESFDKICFNLSEIVEKVLDL